MKRIHLILIIPLILAGFSIAAQSQSIYLKQTNESGIYKKGQRISVTAITNKQIGDSLQIVVLKNNKQQLVSTIKIDNDSIPVFEGGFKESCSIIVEAKLKEEKSKIGFIISPEKLKPGAKCPKDFDAFWNNQKNSLESLPLEVKTNSVKGFETGKGYSCVDTEINCLGPKPARGYFAKPEKATLKSLPIVILFHAAGVKGGWCQSQPQDALKYAKMGTLCFDLNAHGMLNGQPDSYYADLEKGELRGYANQGLTNREDCYFRGMYLRLLRTIDFLTKQPEWDGKRILVIGQSQGGGQALVAAGLDKRVSACVAILPAMCDWQGSSAGRMNGGMKPFKAGAKEEELLKIIPYYDAANILKGSKATICTEIGLIDMTCPSTSTYAAINQAKGKKIIYTVPYRAHENPQKSWVKKWEETVSKPRETFIANYLK